MVCSNPHCDAHQFGIKNTEGKCPHCSNQEQETPNNSDHNDPKSSQEHTATTADIDNAQMDSVLYFG